MCCQDRIAIDNAVVHQSPVGRCTENVSNWQTRSQILNRDCTFFTQRYRADPAGSVFFTGALVHKSAFFSNFTLRTHLKRQHCVSLTFWV